MVPAVSIAVAGIAVVATLLTDPPDRPPPARIAAVVFPENAGLRWNALDAAAPLRVAGDGRHWLAFRAFAPRGGGALSLRGADGTRYDLDIGREPRIRFVGPLTIHGAATYWLMPDGDVFVTGYRLFRRPLAALPGAGFWPEIPSETDPVDANWLSGAGSVDVASAVRGVDRVWLSFDVTSVDRPRTLTLSGGGRTQRVAVPERGDTRHATVGPFRLHDGHASVRLSAPGAVARGTDPRLRTVRVEDLEAVPAP